jgi:hypothetical protein
MLLTSFSLNLHFAFWICYTDWSEYYRSNMFKRTYHDSNPYILKLQDVYVTRFYPFFSLPRVETISCALDDGPVS